MTGYRWLSAAVLTLLLLPVAPLFAADPQVERFTPTGSVKAVRQVTARFTAPMVPFGDPRLVEPFEIDCPEKGTPRWADDRNWVFDFSRDLPGGVNCTFRLKGDVRTVAGERLAGTREFSFTTGGPAIRQAMPNEGSRIDEEQVFILGLDAPAVPASILEHA